MGLSGIFQKKKQCIPKYLDPMWGRTIPEFKCCWGDMFAASGSCHALSDCHLKFFFYMCYYMRIQNNLLLKSPPAPQKNTGFERFKLRFCLFYFAFTS